MIKASASSCFHYTKRITTLKSILQNGLRYSYAFEEFPRGVVEALSNELTGFLSDNVLFPEVKGAGIAIPMISFCDIPLSRSHQHVRKYGRYAIGLNRDYLLDVYEKFFNPVIYSHCQDLKDSLSFFASEMRYTCIRMRHYIERHRMDLPEPPNGKTERQEFLNSLPHELQEDINHHFNESYYLRILLSLYKPIYLKDLRGKIQNFYDEHEWRLYLPDYDVFRWVVNLTKDEYSEEIKSFNAEIAKQELAYVKINSSNFSAINHIIVKNNQERNSIIKFIMESPVLFGCSIKKYDTQRQHLVGKITSFEDIEKDY